MAATNEKFLEVIKNILYIVDIMIGIKAIH